jgi:CubicO group peptidase (beta-lactamase class C family)
MFLIAAIGMALIGWALPASAQTTRRLADDPRVADAVQAWLEWVSYHTAINGIPGVSVGIVHDQELIAATAYGYLDPEKQVPASPETLYSICSISKLFTSIAVLQQRDRGELRLDDPVDQHLSWFKINDAHPDDAAITVRGLLTHSAGLPRESDYPYWNAPDFPFPTSDQIRERVCEQATLYPSAQFFQYSNLGLSLAGEIVAATSAQSYDDYIKAHILTPLGMTDTYTEMPIELRGTRLAVGHSEIQRNGARKVVPPFQARGIAPAAGFASNVVDLAKFAMWQCRVLSGRDISVLKASTLKEMQRVQWMDPDWGTTRGLGFAVSREGDRTFASHGGGCPGYYTHFRLEPKSRIAAIVLTNSIGSETRLYTKMAFEFIAPAIKKALDDPDGAAPRDPQFDRYVGVYDTIWSQEAVVRWNDGLAIVRLKSRSPAKSMTKLEHVSGHTFRRIRDHDEGLGETVTFEVGDDGTVHRFKQHSIWMNKVR